MISHYINVNPGKEQLLYRNIGVIVEASEDNMCLKINTPDGDSSSHLLELIRFLGTDTFLDEITGINSRFEIIY